MSIVARTRLYRPEDEEAVVALSLRAWAPVFASMQELVGTEIFQRQYPDWRTNQADAVGEVLSDENIRVWVSVRGPSVVGFVAVALHAERGIGEIWMLAVDPAHQNAGIGTILTVCMQPTGSPKLGCPWRWPERGGDPGHARPGRTYEKAGYTAMPIVRYFKAL